MALQNTFTVADFLSVSATDVAGGLVQYVHETSGRAKTEQTAAQTCAWETQVSILQRVFGGNSPVDTSEWQLIFEYRPHRTERRIDVLILTGSVVLVLEFKVGEDRILQGDITQTWQYVMDLRHFHGGCEGVPVVGVLVPSEFEGHVPATVNTRNIHVSGGSHLQTCIADIMNAHPAPESAPNLEQWLTAPYRPSRTIIHAASQAFRDTASSAELGLSKLHQASAAGVGGLTSHLEHVIARARANKERRVVFVTGVPGAGKSLVGLQLAFSKQLVEQDMGAATFVTGNGPLYSVLKDAIKRQGKKEKSDALKNFALEKFLQPVHSLIESHELSRARTQFEEHILIFDEAQRAWSHEHLEDKKANDTDRILSEQTGTKQKLDVSRFQSESRLLLRMMSKVPDWCVLVCLVGSQQEINTGEGGLRLWGEALLSEDGHGWDASVSPALIQEQIDPHVLLNPQELQSLGTKIETSPELHLTETVRNVGTLQHSQWVDHFLRGDVNEAQRVCPSIDEFPIWVTRSLDAARRLRPRPSELGELETWGLLASSKAQLLRRVGIEVSKGFRDGFNYAAWFNASLAEAGCCSHLLVAATQFECQGLDLDHGIVVWGEDMTWDPRNGQWEFIKLHGQRLNAINTNSKADAAVDELSQQDFVRNAYRVLLTRARRQLIIVVPGGVDNDVLRCINRESTDQSVRERGIRAADNLDAVYEQLIASGARLLPEAEGQ